MTENERQAMRAENREIFKETSELIMRSEYLWECTRKSLCNSRIYEEDDYIAPGPDISSGSEIILSSDKTINAALKHRGERVAIHNFASATSPGGGVRGGSGAQEESICRTTTLYSVLDNYALSRYYSLHHDMRETSAESFLYTSAFIYTPDIVIIRRDDEHCPVLSADEYQKCDVVTIAAPHLCRGIYEDEKRLESIFVERFDRFFASASANGCTVAVTGAFGCGAFHNNPYLVAKALNISIGKYSRKFRKIELAVFCAATEDRNYRAFRQTFGP